MSKFKLRIRIDIVLLVLMLITIVVPSAWANDWTLQQGQIRKNSLKLALNDFNQSISNSDRGIKYSKMAVSPFIFYRGTAHWYYQDLAGQNTITASSFDHNNAVTWLQGDLHVQNYGAFDDDDGDVVFDLNDFDESWVDSYLWDIYRASASLILVADEQGHSSNNDQQTIVDAFSEFYLDTLEEYRGNDNEKDFKLVEQNAYGRLDEFLDDAKKDNSRTKMLNKWTNDVGSKRQFDLTLDDLVPVATSTKNAITSAISRYKDNLTSNLDGNSSYFTVLDVAKRVNAGTGSLGTERYYVLIEGASSADNDDRILDVKMQGLPSIYPYISSTSQNHLLAFYSANVQGCRVTDAQKAMLTDADDHLGCLSLNGDSFSVRERSPFKESFDTAELTSVNRMVKLAQQWGKVLATAHARADKDYNGQIVTEQFETVMHLLADTKHSEFRAEVFAFAQSYAAQVVVDYDLFVELLNGNQLD